MLVTVMAVGVLLLLLPARVRLMPRWAPVLLGALVIAPVAGVMLTRGSSRWLRIERRVTLAFCLAAGVLTLVTLSAVIHAMLSADGHTSGLQLLSSGCAVWIINVLMFSMLHWQLDAGGPEARADGRSDSRDWLFPQTSAPEHARPGWRPRFMDYLAVAFTTATAFSPTDVLPLTSRAKGYMMLESVISLVTIAVVASRAINVLGQ